MQKKYRWKLIFGDGSVQYRYESWKLVDGENQLDDDMLIACVVIDLDSMTYRKNRYGRCDKSVVASNRLEDHA